MGYVIDGTFEQAEQLHGWKLDRRRIYKIFDSKVYERLVYSSSCAGCTEGIDERGSGCVECGYTGRKRHKEWIEAE